MFAIIETGGKQYAVSPGDHIKIEKLPNEIGSQVDFSRVLLVGDENTVKVGRPTVSGAAVMGKVVAHGRGTKLVVYKLRRRKDSRRKQGHRQYFTEIQVTGISA